MAKTRSSRREFLQGKTALHAVEDTVEAIRESTLDLLPAESLQPERYLVRISRSAMACEFEFWLNAGQYSHGTATAIEGLDLVDQLEAQLTIYRETSEISRLNREAVGHPIRVEPRLFELLTKAIKLWEVTDGAFDITSGPLSQIWGFRDRAGRVPHSDAIRQSLECVGSQYLQLDAAQQTVRFATPGLAINLGAIGKGYALDRCAEYFAQTSINDYLLHGGNSSVLGKGAHSATPDRGWSVGVINPLRPEQRLGQIWLRDRALATSGSATQYFVHEGKHFGHIIDPRSGWPAQGVLSTTVMAPTAAEADALSTAFYILGPERTAEICAQHPEWACLMVCPARRTGTISLHAFGFAEGEWEPRTVS